MGRIATNSATTEMCRLSIYPFHMDWAGKQDPGGRQTRVWETDEGLEEAAEPWGSPSLWGSRGGTPPPGRTCHQEHSSRMEVRSQGREEGWETGGDPLECRTRAGGRACPRAWSTNMKLICHELTNQEAGNNGPFHHKKMNTFTGAVGVWDGLWGVMRSVAICRLRLTSTVLWTTEGLLWTS